MADGPEGIGLQAAARELRIERKTISYWVRQGWVVVLSKPEGSGPGKALILDRESVLACHRNRSRKDPRIRRASRTRGPTLSPAPRPSPAAPAYAPAPAPIPAIPQRPTAELVEQWLEENEATEKSGATIAHRRHIVGGFAKAVPALPCQRNDLVHYLRTLKVGPVSKKTFLTQVRTFLRWTAKHHQLPAPDFENLFQNMADPPPEHLDEAECLLLLEHARNRQERVMFELLLTTGIRAGELCSLTRENIEDSHVVVRGKTGEQRSPITPELCADLRSLSKGYVFRNRFGDPMFRHGVYQRVQAVLELAGIHKKKAGPHMLRHTVGYLSWKFSGDLRYVQELLHHRQISMTQRYTWLDVEDVRERHEQFNPLKGIRDAAEKRETVPV